MARQSVWILGGATLVAGAGVMAWFLGAQGDGPAPRPAELPSLAVAPTPQPAASAAPAAQAQQSLLPAFDVVRVARDGAALVAEAAAQRRHAVVVRHDHAALAGGNLLIGVKPENASPAERTDPPPAGVDSRDGAVLANTAAESFAAIFDEYEFVSLGDAFEFHHPTGVAEGFDCDNRFGLVGNRRFDPRDIDVERFRINIDEDRPRARE